MENFSEKKIQSLKTAFCAGDHSLIRSITEFFFPELWANILLGEIKEQEDALINLENDLIQNRSEFCKSPLTVENYLRKQWKSKLAKLRRKDVSFDEAYMSPIASEIPDQSPKQSSASQRLYPFRHLLATMNPIEKMLFEVKYLQDLNGKNGVFQVTHFLLNAASFGNPELVKILQEKEVLYEPIIRDFLIRQAKNAFTNQQKPADENLVELLQHLPINRKQLKKAFHTSEMSVFRSLTNFRKKQTALEQLNELEKAFVLINDYHKVNHVVKFWTLLNSDAQDYPELKKALKEKDLLDKGYQPKHVHLNGASIVKKRSIGKKQLLLLYQKITAIQTAIDSKIQNKIVWNIQHPA